MLLYKAGNVALLLDQYPIDIKELRPNDAVRGEFDIESSKGPDRLSKGAVCVDQLLAYRWPAALHFLRHMGTRFLRQGHWAQGS